MKAHAIALLRMGNDDEIGPVFTQQTDRIGMKAGNQIKLDLRPMLAKGIHRRHQPIEARMAFDRDSELPGLPLRDARQIPFAILNAAGDVVAQFDEKLTGGGEFERVALSLEQFNFVGFLDAPYLMGDGGLG